MVDQKLSKGKLRSNRRGLWNKMDSNKVKVYAKNEVQKFYGLWNKMDGNKVKVYAKMLRSMEQNG